MSEFIPVVSIILGCVGVVIMFAPTRSLLKVDRRAGYWIYKRELEVSGSEEEAIKSAGMFYKIFGAIFFFFSLSFL